MNVTLGGEGGQNESPSFASLPTGDVCGRTPEPRLQPQPRWLTPNSSFSSRSTMEGDSGQADLDKLNLFFPGEVVQAIQESVPWTLFPCLMPPPDEAGCLRADVDIQMDTASSAPKEVPLAFPFACTLTITGAGRGLKFEVVNLDNLAQPPESVTTLGEWSVKCWVASDDAPTYMFGRIFPISPELTKDDILTGLTVLDDSPTKIVDAIRLPAHVRDDGQTEANMAIRIKFRGPLPDRVSLDYAVYWVRPHTLPVLRCTRCLLFGHGNATCNMRGVCPAGVLPFCGGDHRPANKQCPAYLQAVQVKTAPARGYLLHVGREAEAEGHPPWDLPFQGPPAQELSSPTRHLPCLPAPASQPAPGPAPAKPLSPTVNVVQMVCGCVTPTRPPHCQWILFPKTPKTPTVPPAPDRNPPLNKGTDPPSCRRGLIGRIWSVFPSPYPPIS
ncbi:hypothetical protein GWK47_034457 [Chionoecetes opilio]|uniref:Uncharacterized protein n=1 Tax=Chionoecetes opilio TaxID=41210 RepID=A0A8J4YUU2_CHIOP|nr:hypothetical protein GWK47_034457 [Chionoecetes opilio]